MVRLMQADTVIERISSKQYGAFTRAQAIGAGFSRGAIARRLRSGHWVLVFPGVYRFSCVPRSWKQQVMAALLWAGELAVASHRTAAALLGLGEMQPGIVDITLPGSRRAPKGIVIHRTREIPHCDRATLERLRITTVARTLIDLGAVVDDDMLEIALEDALRRRLTSIEQLRRRLTDLSRQGRPGPLAVKRVLARRCPGTWTSGSTFEVKLLQVIRKHGMPLPVPQFHIRDGDQVIARVDYAYPDIKLAIECESYERHSEIEDWDKDVHRYNELAGLNWRVVRATSRDIADPSRLLRAISMQTDSLSDAKRAKKAKS